MRSLLVVALVPGLAAAQTVHTGTLAPGDDRLGGGEYVDSYEVDLVAGQPFTADLTSTDFDPYLILRGPSGSQEENDDFEGSQTRSRLVTTATEAGTYTVAVTSYSPGETGTYRLEIAEAVALPVDPQDFASGPATGSGPRTGVAGRWVGGAIAATQYEDRVTGQSAPTSGVGTTLDLWADGTFRQSRVMNQTAYSCTTTLHVDEEGTYAVDGADLVLERHRGRSWGQSCGGAPYERDLGPETARFAVTVTAGRGGVATLTRHRDGEVFDVLERAE